ncbi:MAG: hypothetical protein ACXVHY_09580 [Methanobacterium sp.]
MNYKEQADVFKRTFGLKNEPLAISLLMMKFQAVDMKKHQFAGH